MRILIMIVACMAVSVAVFCHVQNDLCSEYKPDSPDSLKASPSKDKIVVESINYEMVYIAPGTFRMGSPSFEPMRDSDERLHKVTLTRGFYMGETEVTLGQWRIFVNKTGYESEAEKEGWAYVWNGASWEKKTGMSWKQPGFPQGDGHPVTCVSFNDALEFIEWLNREEGEGYRLPSEAQWEYACRAGTDAPFYTGPCLSTYQANYNGDFPLSDCSKGIYREKTMPVESFVPNDWGLYDMHGNVWEWCSDWYGEYSSSQVTDPAGLLSGSRRVVRGGSWHDNARFCRSANRGRYGPSYRRSYLGFRLSGTP